MPLSDAIRDRLLSIAIVGRALGDLASTAADNANSDSVTDDPMMQSVRRQFLAVQQMGNEFLTVDRPNTAGTRKLGSAIIAWSNGEINGTSWPQASHDALAAHFKPATTYSETQVNAYLFSVDINKSMFTTDPATLF